MKTTIKVQTTVNCPRVPNFLQREDGTWIPLCALNDDGLIELSQAWLNSCRERVKEQSKDKDFFYKNAVKGES